jgi:cysteine rich repeat protein
MIKMLRDAPALRASMMAILVAAATPAFSQAPTDAQRSAIRSQCGADYQANCASVPPGGMASLQCLQKNISNLSSGCQAAVRAVQAPAEPKAEPKAESAPPAAAPRESAAPAKPAAETAAPATPKETAKETSKETPNESPKENPKENPKPAASTAAKKPNSNQIAALRSACRSDYQKVCADVPTGGAAALQCLEKNKANLSANCQKAVNAAGGTAAPAAGTASPDAKTASPGATSATPPPPVLTLRPMRPREVLFVLNSACGSDVRTLCAGVPPGGGRIMQCLAAQAASLSPACTDVLSQFSAQ